MKKGDVLSSALALAFIGSLLVMLHWNEQRREVPKPATGVVMEKWHRYDRFWYSVAQFDGFGATQDGNLNLQYCKAAISSWKSGDAKKLTGSETYRCREQSFWSSFWQWSRDREAPEKIIAS